MFNKVKVFFTHEDKIIRDNRWIFLSMLIGAIISLIAAFILSVDAIEIAKNPSAALSCSINVIINCATVASHPAASLFGFPNSFLGLIAESVVITVAVAGLAGVKFPRFFMFIAQICYMLGFIFAYYLFYIGLVVIQALCPWCFLVTLSTTFVLFSITRYNIREENLYFTHKMSSKAKKFVEKDYDKLILFSLALMLFVIVIAKYGNGLFA